jgi:tetratricopeptide (TPR) repeat protein
MTKKNQYLKVVLSAFTLWTLCLNSVPVKAQGGEIVGSDDISGGSSVFVFRKSKAAPQAKFASRKPAKRNSVQKEQSRKRVQEQVAKAPTGRQKTPPKPMPIPGKTPNKNNQEALNATSVAFAGGAETYLERGDIDRAINMFRESLKLNPKNELAKAGLSEALVRKAEALYETEGAEVVLQLYQEAARLDEKNSAAFAGLGSVYDELDNTEMTFQNYDKALGLNPNLTELYAPLGVAYYQRGNLAKADELLTKAVAARSEDDQTQYLLGIIRYSQKRFDEAIAALEKSLKIKETPEAHYYLGEIYDEQNKAKESIVEYKKATEINDRYTDAWFDLGAAYYNRQQYDDSIAAYKKAILLKNDNYEAHENLADVYRQLAANAASNLAKTNKPAEMAQHDAERKKNYQLSESEYQLAVALAERDAKDPKKKVDPQALADLYSKYGFILGRLFKWDATISTLNKALAINPDSVDYTNIGWAYYNGAQVDLVNKNKAERLSDTATAQKKGADAQSKLEQGRNALQKATELDPKAVGAFMNLGVTLSDLGDYKGSIEALKKCLTLRNNWLPALNELGIAFRKDGNLPEAINAFKKAVDVDKNFRSGLFNWAEAEYANGNPKEARKIQDRLRKLDPNMAEGLNLVMGSPTDQIKQKVDSKNPLNKLPKIPY